jgi:hypothetical protein
MVYVYESSIGINNFKQNFEIFQNFQFFLLYLANIQVICYHLIYVLTICLNLIELFFNLFILNFPLQIVPFYEPLYLKFYICPLII